MKKNIVVFIAILLIIECQGQEGISLSQSTNNTFIIDIFARGDNNRLHFGYSHQFNGQKGKVEKTKLDGSTETEKGKYFWTCDLGYSRIFFNHIAVHSELSIGGSKKFTNFKDERDYIDDYSVITSRNLAVGIGLKLGYSFKFGFEPFIGFNTLKKVDIGARVFW
ncbi:hypothetical protein [Aestuariivivens insulae]|uniref:hypothetical protein n=1 Tax=Aestuariivivens insulae TaxID=1621988 RepID=UPI001F59F1B2|nr:hypothetical protein [Aestuariivivens insulae]